MIGICSPPKEGPISTTYVLRKSVKVWIQRSKACIGIPSGNR